MINLKEGTPVSNLSNVDAGSHESSKTSAGQLLFECYLALAPPPGLREARKDEERAVGFLASPRCAEKGCIFPARPGGNGTCFYHEREEREPACFESQQPSLLLLQHAKFGVTDPYGDYTRAHDIRELAAARAAFLEVV